MGHQLSNLNDTPESRQYSLVSIKLVMQTLIAIHIIMDIHSSYMV